MRITVIVLFLAAVPLLAQSPAAESSDQQALYERGVRFIEEGRYQPGRLALQTLLNAYPETSLASEARAAIRESWVREGIPDVDAFLLYSEGMTRLSAGQHEAARLAFQTLINLYPASEYLPKAKDAILKSRVGDSGDLPR
jgi:TolA-binding protein